MLINDLSFMIDKAKDNGYNVMHVTVLGINTTLFLPLDGITLYSTIIEYKSTFNINFVPIDKIVMVSFIKE